MMKMWVSAEAAAVAKMSNAPAKTAGASRISHQGMRGALQIDKLKSLIIRSRRDASRRRKRLFRGPSILTRSLGLPHGAPHERFPRHLHYLRDYELANSWLRPSFLKH